MEKKSSIFFRALTGLGPLIGSGAYETYSGTAIDVWLVNSVWAWIWLAGVVSGYAVWDLTNPLAKSAIKSFYVRVRGNSPLSLRVVEIGVDSDNGDRSEIVALVDSTSGKKIKAACITADTEACDTREKLFLEYCVDIPPKARNFVIPLFDVEVPHGANSARYKINSRYLKTQGVDTGWCQMSDRSFDFEPCFSSDTQKLDCLIECTVIAPCSKKLPVAVVERYGQRD